jgi:hypothetical protein
MGCTMRVAVSNSTGVVFGSSLALTVLVALSWFGHPAYGQTEQAAKAVISGTVVDREGRPVAGAVIGYVAAERIRANAERRVSLRYDTPVGRMNEEQKQEVDRLSLIYPERTYMGGHVVGYTDSSGVFLSSCHEGPTSSLR